MKKLLLVMEEERMLSKYERRAIEYCANHGLDYIGRLAVSKEDALENPKSVFKNIQAQNADIVLADGPLMMLSELSKEKSLLAYLEDADIDCFNVEQDHVKTRDFVEGVKNILAEVLDHSIPQRVPAVVLYRGNDGYEDDQDFKDIVHYIKEHLGLNHFSLTLYRKEEEEMLSELAETLKDATPKYIIQRETFKNPRLNKFMDMIELDSNQLDVQIIHLDEIKQELYPEQKSEININLILH